MTSPVEGMDRGFPQNAIITVEYELDDVTRSAGGKRQRHADFAKGSMRSTRLGRHDRHVWQPRCAEPDRDRF